MRLAADVYRLALLCWLPLLLQCSGNAPEPEAAPALTELLDQRIRALSDDGFEVSHISSEGRALRIDIALKEIPESEAETRQRTLDALHVFQRVVGDSQHLAVWAYAGNPLTVQGMAFYSSISEQYVFKAAGELK